MTSRRAECFRWRSARWVLRSGGGGTGRWVEDRPARGSPIRRSRFRIHPSDARKSPERPCPTTTPTGAVAASAPASSRTSTACGRREAGSARSGFAAGTCPSAGRQRLPHARRGQLALTATIDNARRPYRRHLRRHFPCLRRHVTHFRSAAHAQNAAERAAVA